ncbi:MAG: Uma2 family endonuclease [Lachnospiraceae bacterium]|nr:Uma2 family endonuclease [Lachnospiraceae bacterium]
MGTAAKVRRTIQDVLNTPEDVRVELVDGFLYNMASPTTTHQRIVFKLGRKVADFLEAKKCGCETFVAPFAVFVRDDEYNYVEPDIVVVCDPDKIKEDGCHGAPDLVVEVTSESSRTRDYLTKLRLYDDAGVKEYWIMDLENNRATVYRLNENEDLHGVAEFSFKDSLTSWLFPDMQIDLSDL